MRSRTLRSTASLGLALVMLTSVAVVGSTAFGKPKPSAAQYQYKVTVCHRTKSQKKPGITIRVSAKALPAHERHGDTLGPCPSVSQTTASSGSTAGSGKGKSNSQGNKGQGQGASQGQSNGKGKNK